MMDGLEKLSLYINWGVIAFDSLLKVFIALVALAIAYVTVGWIQSRDDKLEQIRANWSPEAQAIYRGLTMVAICILLGLILSSNI